MWIKLSTTFGYYKHFIFLAFQKLPDSMFTHSILINISRINQIYPLFVCSLQCIHSYLLIKRISPFRTKLPSS